MNKLIVKKPQDILNTASSPAFAKIADDSAMFARILKAGMGKWEENFFEFLMWEAGLNFEERQRLAVYGIVDEEDVADQF